MALSSLVTAVLIIIIILLILRLIMKSLKLIVMIAVAVVILVIWVYGFSGLFDKVSDVKEIPELGIERVATSITGCTSDIDCSYVIDSGDCSVIPGYCSNTLKEENYRKMADGEVSAESCDRKSVQINYTIDCECRLHKEREGVIKRWLGNKVEEKVGYTYCWKKGDDTGAVTAAEPGTNAETLSYTACGCGCCPDVEPVKRCLYKSQGDDIQDFIIQDKNFKEDMDCNVVGCSKPISYSYCD